VHECDVHTGT